MACPGAIGAQGVTGGDRSVDAERFRKGLHSGWRRSDWKSGAMRPSPAGTLEDANWPLAAVPDSGMARIRIPTEQKGLGRVRALLGRTGGTLPSVSCRLRISPREVSPRVVDAAA
jgi:hypothetical protein